MEIDGRYEKTLKRINAPGMAHYLTFSTYKRFPFLKYDLACRFLCDSINFAREKHEFDLWAYVFMPDHVHLMIFPRNKDYDIGKILSSIKIPISRKMVEYWKKYQPEILEKVTVREGQRVKVRFWEAGGGYERVIYEADTYQRTIEYIHNNPVVKSLCETYIDWIWSSAGWYAGKRDCPLQIDETMPVI